MANQPHIIGIDLGKHWFHLIGLDRDGAIVLRKKMSRAQLSAFAATVSQSVVAMEGRFHFYEGHSLTPDTTCGSYPPNS